MNRLFHPGDRHDQRVAGVLLGWYKAAVRLAVEQSVGRQMCRDEIRPKRKGTFPPRKGKSASNSSLLRAQIRPL